MSTSEIKPEVKPEIKEEIISTEGAGVSSLPADVAALTTQSEF